MLAVRIACLTAVPLIAPHAAGKYVGSGYAAAIASVIRVHRYGVGAFLFREELAEAVGVGTTLLRNELQEMKASEAGACRY